MLDNVEISPCLAGLNYYRRTVLSYHFATGPLYGLSCTQGKVNNDYMILSRSSFVGFYNNLFLLLQCNRRWKLL